MPEKKETAVRIELGLDGGQSFSLRLKPAEYEKLRKAVGSDGWKDFDSEDGIFSVDLSKVAFIKVDSDEFSIGFSNS